MHSIFITFPSPTKEPYLIFYHNLSLNQQTQSKNVVQQIRLYIPSLTKRPQI